MVPAWVPALLAVVLFERVYDAPMIPLTLFVEPQSREVLINERRGKGER